MSREYIPKKRRSPIDIISDVLKVTKEPKSKTFVMYQARLNYDMLKKYLNITTRNGFVKEFKSSERTSFVITDKGLKFLRIHERLRTMFLDTIVIGTLPRYGRENNVK